jgi:hypothetical protein
MSAFTIRELDVPDAMRVELAADDAPEGFPDEEAAFTTGGDVQHKAHRLHGRRSPLVHVFTVEDEPLEIKGRFVDYKMGRGHADAMRDKIERMRARANTLRITWGSKVWRGLLIGTRFPEEGYGYIGYELKFLVIDAPEVSAAPPQASAPPASADTLAAARAYLAGRARPPRMPSTFLDKLNAVLDGADSAVNAMESGLRELETQRNNVLRRVRRVTSLGTRAQVACAEAREMIRDTERQVRGIAGNVTAFADLAAWVHDTDARYLGTKAAVRAAMVAARSELNAGTRLYRVRPGDTPELIARRMLHDAGRAGELGLVPGELVAGRVIRVPLAQRVS